MAYESLNLVESKREGNGSRLLLLATAMKEKKLSGWESLPDAEKQH